MFKPQVFGKYLLIDKISHGGMGEVYKAKSFGSQGFEKLFAVKRILPKLSKTSAYIDMLADEAKIIVHLSHSNIAQVYEFSEVDKTYYLAMEFVHGKDVRSILERTENVPIEVAAHLIAELCRGLHYLHNVTNDQGEKLGIVHRDISPRNIIVSFEGEVKIIDFGIANARTRAFTIGNDIFVGKYSYMSPEQLTGKNLTHKSDIFSSGIVLYELIFGKLPPGKIRDRNLIQLDKENIDVDPHLEKKLLEKLPAELRSIIEKATAIRAEDRYDRREDRRDRAITVCPKSAFVYVSNRHDDHRDNWRDHDRRNDYGRYASRSRYDEPRLELRYDRELRMQYAYDHGRRIYVRG
jgi:serine/threonine protein kinase